MFQDKRFKISIFSIEDKEIFLKTNYSWASCLNANYSEKLQKYYLNKNYFNFIKLTKITPFNFNHNSYPKLEKNFSSPLQLRPYQKEDVDFLKQNKSIGIFNEMRTGKTPTALVVFSNWLISNLLIICPNILQQHWQESVEKWLFKPAYIISYLNSNERKVIYQKFCQENNWVIIVSKDIFKLDSKYFRELRKKTKPSFCTIIDEAHFLRNYQSQQSKSLYTLKDSDYKMVLTGTPIVNHSIDIFGILKFLFPETYTSYWKFAEKFYYIHETEVPNKGFKLKKILGFKNDELYRELKSRISKFSVTRKQKEVLPWLPLVEYREEKLLMLKNQQEVYSRWTKKWDKNYPLEFLAKLKTLTLHPPSLINEFKKDFLSAEDKKKLKECQGIKISFLINFCQENLSKSILIFSTRTETFLEPLAHFLQSKKIKIGLITGKIQPSQRIEFINDFQQKKINILLCNIQSAGLGLNLSQAEVAIFADRSYSPADNEQAEARFLPTKNYENSNNRVIIDLVCKSSIDEKILKLLKRKQDIIKIILTNPNYLISD